MAFWVLKMIKLELYISGLNSPIALSLLFHGAPDVARLDSDWYSKFYVCSCGEEIFMDTFKLIKQIPIPQCSCNKSWQPKIFLHLPGKHSTLDECRTDVGMSHWLWLIGFACRVGGVLHGLISPSITLSLRAHIYDA